MKYLLKLKIVFKIKFYKINLCYIYTHSFKNKQLLSKNKIWIMVTREAFLKNMDIFVHICPLSKHPVVELSGGYIMTCYEG